jgi:anti-anti-sigma regulatory factor
MIGRSEGPGPIFKLSGRIDGSDVPELQKLIAEEAAGTTITLDLQEVRLVDREA